MERYIEKTPNQKWPRKPWLRFIFVFLVISLILVACFAFLYDPDDSLSKDNAAILDAQALYTNAKAYQGKEGKLPTSVRMLRFYFDSPDSLIDPWGREYQIEFLNYETTGQLEPVIWTTSPKGKRIQWPRR